MAYIPLPNGVEYMLWDWIMEKMRKVANRGSVPNDTMEIPHRNETRYDKGHAG